MYGWYSEKQAETSGVIVYKDESGFDVLVTEVTQDDKYTSFYRDVRPIGFLGEFVRRESWGSSRWVL